MNIKQSFFIVISIFAIMALSACEGQSNPQPAQTQATISATDQANFQGALELKDLTYCDKIVDSDYQKNCKNQLNDSKQLEQALLKMDAKLCATLSSKDQQDACKIKVEVAQKEAQAQKTQNDNIAADQKLSLQIITSKDYKRCQELKLPSSQYDCEMNILPNQALQTKDLSWCEKGSTEQVKSSCKSLYKTALNAAS